MDACLNSAKRLRELLLDETEALRHFDGPKLLQLIPAKEGMIKELASQLENVKKQCSVDYSPAKHPEQLLLKQCLQDINATNQTNAIFIEGTLAFYQDLFRCIYPSGYSRGGENIPGTEPPKGLRFSKEI